MMKEEIKPMKDAIFADDTPIEEQVNYLGEFLLENYPNQIINDGAIGTAIQILKDLKANPSI